MVEWMGKSAPTIRCHDSMLIFYLLVCSLTLCFAVVATAKPLSNDRPVLTIQWRVVPSSTTAAEAAVCF